MIEVIYFFSFVIICPEVLPVFLSASILCTDCMHEACLSVCLLPVSVCCSQVKQVR